MTRRLGLLAMSIAFWSVFASSLAVVTAAGHCISARWSLAPVCGADFWWVVVTSPEVLIFMFFMITDPMTSPVAPRDRIVFGASVGLASTLLVAPMQTEFGAKVAVLSGLVAVCAMRPLVTLARERSPRLASGRPRVIVAALVPVAVVLLVVAGLPARTSVLTGSAVVAGAVDARPDVRVPAGTVPTVVVSDEVGTVIEDQADERATQMADDLVEALIIEADAAASRDVGVAASAIAGQRLEDFPEGVSDGSFVFDTMRVVLVRDPTDPQAVPRLGIHATGAQGGTPLDRIFVLEDVGGTWLLTDAHEPGPA